MKQQKGLSTVVKDDLAQALVYFTNHLHIMDYAGHLAERLPIGSVVTEATCKTLVKQRLCGSGMRWKNQGAGILLSLKSLLQSGDRWEQFWHKINQFGALC